MEQVALGRTYLDEGRDALTRLSSKIGLSADLGTAIISEFHRALGPLAAQAVPDRAPWHSGISDDSSPYEFSLVLSAEPEIRVLWESQGSSGDLLAKRAAGLETQARLCESFDAASDRFDAIADLFLPREPEGIFALWHAARLWPLDRGSELKAYFNPQARGRARSPALVEEALQRLGFRDAWRWVAAAMPRGPDLDEIRYFSLDLLAGDAARVKIYVYHRNPTPDVLAAAAGTCPDADPDEIVAFYHAMTGRQHAAGDFCPGSCLSFASGTGARPISVTLHVPVRGYARHDGEVIDRVATLSDPLVPGKRALLTDDALATYRAAVAALAKRSTETGIGLTSYVSLRSQRSRERVTCYLSTESFESEPARETVLPALPAQSSAATEPEAQLARSRRRPDAATARPGRRRRHG